MPYQANTTLVCLIPKSDDTTSLKNFKSIGLYNTNCKLVTKIIVNIIKSFLPTIISPCQDSFLSNRRAVDNDMIVQEYLTHFAKMKGKKASMIIKVDLGKAFDRLEWSFIRKPLTSLDFPLR